MAMRTPTSSLQGPTLSANTSHSLEHQEQETASAPLDEHAPSEGKKLSPSLSSSAMTIRYRFLLSKRQSVICEITLCANGLQSSDRNEFFLSLGAAAIRKQLGSDS